MQAFSAALSTELSNFNSKLADLHSTYANGTSQTTSLIALQNLLRNDLELFREIKSLVTTSYPSNILLSHLHELTCQAQAIGSKSLHGFLLRLFLASLETYLRPVHGWMTQGHLNNSNYPEFFVTSTLDNNHYVFDVVRDNGGPIAPKFMLHVVNRVLAAGKTMDFVNRLNPISPLNSTLFTPFLQAREIGPLNPFEQAFESALDAWIMEKYSFASLALKGIFHLSSDLWTQLDCIHGIYLMLSYDAMTRFMTTLFQKVILLWGFIDYR